MTARLLHLERLTRHAFLVLYLAFIPRQHLIARIGHRLTQVRERDRLGQILHRGLFGSQVDVDVQHTGHGRQGSIHVRDTTGAGHPANRQSPLFDSYFISGIVNRPGKCIQVDHRGIVPNRRMLSSQIDDRITNPIYALQCPLDVANARSTRHALDRQRYLFLTNQLDF